MSNKAWHATDAGSGFLFWQDGIDRGWFRTNRSALHGLPDLTPILATVREVASGMAHLHSMNILHGDLTSLNVLLASSDDDNRGFIAKVSFITSPACVCAEWGQAAAASACLSELHADTLKPTCPDFSVLQGHAAPVH